MINILDLIYPPVCGFCGKINKEYLCNKCRANIKKYEIKSKSSYKVRNNEFYFDELFCIFKYEDVIRDIIIKYKFQNKPYLYKTFSKIILNNKKICGFLKKYDIIIPVPTNKNRKRSRGYNQTELIARDVARELKIEMENNILIKIIDTKSQSGLNRKDRIININNAFEMMNGKKIENKNILIVDDIYTTGSTANECARVLKKSMAKEIGVLTIAKDYKK